MQSTSNYFFTYYKLTKAKYIHKVGIKADEIDGIWLNGTKKENADL
jgi:hypothetical protein